MAAIVALLVTVTITLLTTRIATVALMVTGLSRESARFQARSALTGVGFTTRESEKVTLHPVRRRVIMILMLFGNAGIVTLTAALLGSMVMTTTRSELISNMSLLVLGLLILWLISTSHWIDRRLSRIIFWSLRRWTSLDVSDYVGLLHVAAGYTVTEMAVEPGDWLVGQSLAEAALPREGVLILGVQRPDGTYIGAPTAQTCLCENDILIIYGASERVRELNQRKSGPAGAAAHSVAVEDQKRRVERERAQDPSEDQ